MVKCIDCLHWNGDKNGYWCVFDNPDGITEKEKVYVKQITKMGRKIKIPDDCNPAKHGIEHEHNCPYFEATP